MNRNILFFDFEVFKHDWLLCVKYLKEDKWINIHNNVEMLIEFLKSEKESLWVGFNSNHYDIWILNAILQGLDPFVISKKIIEENLKGWQLGLKSTSIATIDLKQDNIDNLSLSLKEVEANIGLSIEESNVDFNLDRKLTNDELMLTLKYCKHDVLATQFLFKQREDWVESKINLINQNGWPLSDAKKTSAQLTSKALGALKRSSNFNDDHIYDVPHDLNLGKYSELLNYFKSPLPNPINKKYVVASLEHKFGIGGLHGAFKKIHSKPNKSYAFLDFVSYYPNMMINRNYISRNMSSPLGYAKIFEERVNAKKNGNLEKAQALKMIIVTTYGAMDNQYNPLYDPKMRKHVAISGQLFLVDLIDKIEPYINLIQTNTDGVLVEVLNENKLKDECEKFEKRTKFELDWDFVEEFYQKDVNNYFAKLKNGNIKIKGGYLKQAQPNYKIYSKNNMRIVDLALYAYFDKKIDPTIFIKNHKNIHDFQMVAKATRIFDGGLIEVKQNNENVKWGNVARIFATLNKENGEMFKLKKGMFHKVPNMPKHSFVWNKDINELNKEDINLDYDFYINLVINRLNDFGIKL